MTSLFEEIMMEATEDGWDNGGIYRQTAYSREEARAVGFGGKGKKPNKRRSFNADFTGAEYFRFVGSGMGAKTENARNFDVDMRATCFGCKKSLVFAEIKTGSEKATTIVTTSQLAYDMPHTAWSLFMRVEARDYDFQHNIKELLWVENGTKEVYRGTNVPIEEFALQIEAIQVYHDTVGIEGTHNLYCPKKMTPGLIDYPKF